MVKRSKFVGRSIWRLDDSYEFILSETTKYVVTDLKNKILKEDINEQPKTGQLVELGEWKNQ